MTVFIRIAKGASVCDAFGRVSSSVWDTIRDTRKSGVVFGEETMTDIVLFSLVRRFPRQIIVHKFTKPAEGKSGADWLWCFVGKKGCFVMQVQAKKLFGDEFTQLDHQIGKKKPKPWQVDVLIADAKVRKTYPAYVFYSHLNAKLRRHARLTASPCKPNWGCSVGSALKLKPMIKARKKKFVDLCPTYIEPWVDLVCGHADPAVAAEKLAKNWSGGAGYDGYFKDCKKVPAEVAAVAAKYAPAKSAPGKGDAEQGDNGVIGVGEQNVAGVVIVGDIESSCLIN